MGNSQIGCVSQHGSAQITTFYTKDTWIEGRAEDQLQAVAKWPGITQIAAFPDLHPGRHGPVGAAFLADRIYPQLVGPDIGCGMALFRLDLPRRKLKVEKVVSRLSALEEVASNADARDALRSAGVTDDVSTYGLGTIGGGNHFCEVQHLSQILDVPATQRLGLEKHDLFLLVHTGSRNQGATIFNDLEATWKLGYESGTDAAIDYLRLHDYALRWAHVNRLLVAKTAAQALRCNVTLVCDSVHNAVVPFGDKWLHRKGAAAQGDGIVPLAGSRDSKSFLLDTSAMTPGALQSLSHGAGRRYDRGSMHGRIERTKSSLTKMRRNKFGGTIVCDNANLLIEEAGHAYKNAEVVVSDLQKLGVATPIAAFEPLITYKTSTKGERS